MTNKLPVVGKRYRRLHCGNEYELISFCESRNSYFLKAITGIDKDAVFEFSNYFAEKHFEELPETKLPIAGNRYLRIGEGYEIVVKKVERDRVYFRMADENNKESFSCPLEFFWGDFEELPEDKAETKPETQSPELSPEVKEAMEKLKDDIKAWVDDVFGDFTPLSRIKPLEPGPVYETLMMINDLLNALDKQFMSKEEVKIDTRQERVDSIKVNETNESVDVKEEEVNEKEEKSIWRPVSELPEESVAVLLCSSNRKKIDYGFFSLQRENQYIEKGFYYLNFTYEWPSGHRVKPFFAKEAEKYCTLTDFINDYEKLKERVKKLEEK